MNIFRSARLKLTAFYFGIIVVLCLFLTIGIQGFMNHELDRGDSARQGAVNQWFEQYNTQLPNSDYFGQPSDTFFSQTQQRQSDRTRQNLARDFVLLDIGLLVLGALLSYWYAGRTLKPIEEMHEQQKRFTADASHELRTPLASMKLENEIFLRQKSFTDKDARELITSNLEEVDRLERLAVNLLALSDYEKMESDHEPVLIDKVVDDAITQAKKSKAARKINFVKTIETAKVDVNKDGLVQLVGILLDNAVKYGNKKANIDIDGEMVGDGYQLIVRDHGPGIAEDDLPYIFDRMYRGDKARSSKVAGHGIGLSLAKQIAAANDISLTAYNAEGGGAAFMLTLS